MQLYVSTDRDEDGPEHVAFAEVRIYNCKFGVGTDELIALFDPLVGNFYGTGKGNALEGRRNTAFAFHAMPFTLTVETLFAHIELAAYPLGLVTLGGANPGHGDSSWDLGHGKSYSAALTLSAGWSLNAM